jgi:hypothetical protein
MTDRGWRRFVTAALSRWRPLHGLLFVITNRSCGIFRQFTLGNELNCAPRRYTYGTARYITSANGQWQTYSMNKR